VEFRSKIFCYSQQIRQSGPSGHDNIADVGILLQGGTVGSGWVCSVMWPRNKPEWIFSLVGLSMVWTALFAGSFFMAFLFSGIGALSLAVYRRKNPSE